MAPTGSRRGQSAVASTSASADKRKRRLKSSVAFINTHNGRGGITGRNIYNQLSDNDDSSVEEESLKKKTKPNLPKPPPPITIQSHTIQQLKPSIQTIKGIDVSKVNFKITQNGVKILTPDMDTHSAVKSHCSSNGMHGFTHTPPEERQVKICLYGLWSMPTNELLSELILADITPTDIKQLTLKKPRYSNQAIYLLYFKREQHMTIEKLKAVRGLFNVVVDWRYYRNNSKEPIQCSICLQFGHGQKSCFGKSPVCYRCAGDHAGSTCPFLKKPAKEGEKPRIDDALVQCALCKEKGHTASDRKCKKRQEFKEMQQSLRMRQRPQSSRQSGPNIYSAKDFPAPPGTSQGHPLSTASRKFTPAPIPTHSAWTGRTNTPRSSNLLTTDECMDLFDYFVDELLKCKSKLEQIRTIARLSLEQVSKYLSAGIHDDRR